MTRRATVRRLGTWAIALVAIGFVSYVVPLRDRCAEPAEATEVTVAESGVKSASASVMPLVPVSRGDAGCVLSLASGPKPMSLSECAQLRCEDGLVTIFRRSDTRWLGALFVLYLCSTVFWAARWQRLLGLARVRQSFGWVWRVTLQAQAVGVLLPSGIGSDAFRGTAAVEAGASVPIAVGSLLLDRAVGLATLTTLGFLGGSSVGGGAKPRVVEVLGCVPVGFVVGVLFLRSAAVRRMPFVSRGVLAKAVKPMLDYLGDRRAPRAIAGAAAMSLMVSASSLGINRGLMVAVGAHPTSEKWAYVGLTLVFCTAVLPSLPGGWGTADAASIYFLGMAGLPPSSALAVCLLNRLFWYLSGAIGAVLLVLRPGSVPLSSPPSAPQDPEPRASAPP